ncbi:phage tail sheath family protein [Rubrivirga sp.]|uniref:phage tail sheath family protein n=1 Tax=Rubrivirga sp. TaxID=1885344 RepID=UPI003B51A35D
MPTAPTYPGVYIEEVPSGVRTITGVATSVAAFLGYFSRGPMNRPVRIFNFGNFERAFGGLRADSEAAYAIQQFFLNGGGQAYVVRTAATVTEATASVTLRDGTDDVLTLDAVTAGAYGNGIRVGVSHEDATTPTRFNLIISVEGPLSTTETHFNVTLAEARDAINAASGSDLVTATLPAGASGRPDAGVTTLTGGVDAAPAAASVVLGSSADGPTGLLTLTAASEGTWGNALHALVDYNTVDPATTFNLTVVEVGVADGRTQTVATEVFRNLTLDPASSRYVVDVVNGGSALVRAEAVGTPDAMARPAHSGTLSGPVDLDGLSGGETLKVSVDEGTTTYAVGVDAGTPSSVAALAADLQSKIRAAHLSLATVTVRAIGTAATQQHLHVSSSGATSVVTFSDVGADGDTLAGLLGLDNAGRTNVQQYVLGTPTAAGAQILPGTPAAQQAGADGSLPNAAALIGTEADKTGLFALLDIDLFNLLSVPDTMRLTTTDAAAVATAATLLAERERAFYILDAPQPADNPLDLPTEIETWLGTDGANLRHKNVALYYPRPAVPDPLNDFRLREVAPSGTMAGVYARTDATRGVWKAPAGTEAVLRGTQRLEYTLTDAENGVLNPLGINALRTFPVFGTVAWGARTLDGADALASEWKYVPIRRLALYIEESLFRGTQWVVFEPNDETLWAQIRLNVGTFMHTLFRQGAFQGAKPSSAYFVKCDAEANPQADIDRGIVNVVVGFAPLKPAEFVIVKIQQMAGQLDV